VQRPGPYGHARVAPQDVAVARLVDEVQDLGAHAGQHVGAELRVLDANDRLTLIGPAVVDANVHRHRGGTRS
jgi:hypothetical protein